MRADTRSKLFSIVSIDLRTGFEFMAGIPEIISSLFSELVYISSLLFLVIIIRLGREINLFSQDAILNQRSHYVMFEFLKIIN